MHGKYGTESIMSNNFVITVGRQYGSGGREIAQRVAEILGIKSYGKELIRMAAERSGLHEDTLATVDERATSSLLYTLAMGSASYSGGNSGLGFNMPVNDKLFVVQSEIMKELAEKESCVIIGRCGDYVLRDHPKKISVFIYADMDKRVERIMERHDLTADAAKDIIAKTDKRRVNYYNFYTGRKWGKYEHYDISINSGLLGIERTAQMIADIVKNY